MAERKRVTTAPLTPEEIHAALFEIPEEEFLERFDEIFSGDVGMPDTLEHLISLDDYMEHELRDMFQSIIAQYIKPVEYAINQIRDGDQSRRVVEEGLEALVPIVKASESLEYADITALLRSIERPLRDLQKGVRRRLSKRDVDGLLRAYHELQNMLSHTEEREATPSPGLSLGALPRYLKGVSSADVKRLRNAGLSTLRELATAPAADIAAVTGLSEPVAERVRTFSSGVVAAASAPGRRTQGTPAGWMRVQIDSDVFRGRLTFEYAALGRYIEPILARLAESEERTIQVARPKPRAERAKKK